MRFTELWKLTQTVYREISFQSVFLLRAGAMLPKKGRGSITQLVKNASTNTRISKILTTIFIAAFALTVFLPIQYGLVSQQSTETFLAGGISAYLTIVLSLISIMGLQVSTSFVSSKILEVLGPLPLTKRDVSSIIFLCFTRIFDLPLISSIIILLSLYLFIGGSAIGALILLAAITVTEIFALALTIGLARFFYSRVASGSGRSRWKAMLRIIFMLVWILPSFGTYLVTNFSNQIIQTFAHASQPLLLAYPFCFGFLVSFASFSQNINLVTLYIAVGTSAAYTVLALFALRWVVRSISKISVGATPSSARELVKDTLVSPQRPWLGIIRKDLRVASRAPSYASLFLLPPLETALLGLSLFSSGETGFAAVLGILVGSSLVTLVLPPTLLSIEGLASSYTRSLPLTKRTVISAKAMLSTLMYASSLLLLILVALCIGKDAVPIIAFGVVQMFGISAASLLELLLSARIFWKEGFAIGNIYARLSTYIALIIPGMVLALAPVAVAVATFVLATRLTIWVYFAVALAEFAVMALIVYKQ